MKKNKSNKIHVLRIEGLDPSTDTNPEFFEKCELEAQALFNKKKDEFDSFVKEFIK